MGNLRSYLRDSIKFDAHPLGEALLPVLSSPTGRSARGYAYLQGNIYHHLRDRVPHLLGMGQRVMEYLISVEVVRAVVRTTAITAPSDLWFLSYRQSPGKELSK